MFGKVGRAGGGRRGGGNGNRNLHPPTMHRPVGPTSASRLSVGGGGSSVIRHSGGRGGRQGADRVGSSASAVVMEESFSMTSDGPFDFGSIIRLIPALVDEIRRAEEKGVPVRIKFDPNSNDSAVNVIDVGGKEYSFTWSNDFSGLCDIYAECRNSETGNGLLVECGSSCRKLNVQPIFDESAKERAKKRSEEVLQNKARRAIILELPNQSSAAAVEGNMRKKKWKSKEPPLKKQKTEITQSLKLGYSKAIVPKSKASPSLHSRVGQSLSPFQSPPEKTMHNLLRDHTNTDILASFAPNHEDAATFENETDEMIVEGPCKTVGNNHGVSPQHVDLRNMLITLLSQASHGITLKSFENAVKKKMPNCLKGIEAVLKSIAIFKAPGKYILKPGVGIENSNMPLSECESSQDNAQERSTVADTMKKSFMNNEFELQPQLRPKSEQEPVKFEKIDKVSVSSDPFSTDRKVSDENDDQACTSSGSDSDSDSDSSDSGSDSGSQSRSRSKSKSPVVSESGSDSGSQSRSRSISKSPVVSESGSSSDSDSNASSSSSETQVKMKKVDITITSDVDVDITNTSDDEKDGAQSKCKSLASELLLLSSPRPCSEQDGQHNKKDGNKQDDNVRSLNAEYDNVVIDDDMSQAVKNDDRRKTLEYHENGGTITQIIGLYGHKTASESLQEMMNLPSNQYAASEIDKVVCDGSLVNGELEKFPMTKNTTERTSKSKKFKKPLEMESLREKKGAKKPKGHFTSSGGNRRNNTVLSEEPRYASLEKSEQKNKRKDSMMAIVNTDVFQDLGTTNNLQMESDIAVLGKHKAYANSKQNQLTSDLHNDANFNARKSWQKPSSNPNPRMSFSAEESEGKFGRSSKHGERASYAHLEESDAHIRNKFVHTDEKYTAKLTRVNTVAGGRSSLPELQNKLQKDNGQSSHFHSAGMDNFGKESSLQRTFSELEVGEFREPLSEDVEGSKAQMGSPPKTFENEVNTIEDATLDLVKRKASGKINSSLEGRSRKNQEVFQKKITEIPPVESTKPQQQPQQLLRPTFTDSETSHFDNNRSSYWSEPGNRATSYKKNSFGCYPDGNNGAESTKAVQKIIEPEDDPVQKKDVIIKNGKSNSVKMTKSSPEEDLLFSKFEKDKPEEKGPIPDFIRYNEYVQEYGEKHKCYLALKYHMDKIRDEFLKIGGEFPELSKVRDTQRYNDCCQRICTFHRFHKMRLNRLRKTFDVLHIELSTLKKMIKAFVEEYTKE